MNDYPATHSMDTEWFAVDRDGNLAIFSSGEDGAVPEGASDNGWDIVRDVFLQAPMIVKATSGAANHFTWPIVMQDPYAGQRSGCLFALFGIGRRPAPPPRAERLVATPAGAVMWVGMLLRSTEVLEEIDPDNRPKVGNPVEGPEGKLYPAWFDEMHHESYQHLHNAGACYRCIWCEDEKIGMLMDNGKVGSLGLYSYRNDEYGLSPYVRIGNPASPLRVSDLPEELREHVSKVRLNGVSFAEASHVQPIEHVKCHVWAEREEGITYLSEDMQTRKPFVRTDEDEQREGHDE